MFGNYHSLEKALLLLLLLALPLVVNFSRICLSLAVSLGAKVVSVLLTAIRLPDREEVLGL